MPENSLEATSFLIFKLRDSRFALDASDVREIIALPEITPLEETRAYIAGVINLRGQIVPIIDLNLRLGYLRHRWKEEDNIVLVDRAGSLFGIVVNEVINVCDNAGAYVEPLPAYTLEAQPEAQFLTGLLKLDGGLIMLLNLEMLLTCPPDLTASRDSEPSVSSGGLDVTGSETTLEERAVFRRRAQNLAVVSASANEDVLLPHAVVRLRGELFGIDLRSIREFAEMRTVTPIPCCPMHVVGQVNLRGDLITLIDITDILGLQPDRSQIDKRVVVANDAGLRVGVLVDAVLGVIYLDAADLKLAASESTTEAGRTYLEGAVPYESRMLTVLNLTSLLMHKSLLVNEKP